MKRDVQVGVILGVIILAIIGVFLSTRTTIKEPVIPIPEMEEDTQVGVLDIHDLPQDPFNESGDPSAKVVSSAQDAEQKKPGLVNTENIADQLVEKQDTIIEGEWKKAKDVEVDAVVAGKDKIPNTTGEQENWMGVSREDIRKHSANFQIHKVQSREDLCKIAKKYYGDASKWPIIYNSNRDKLQNQNVIQIGMELIIPEIVHLKSETKTIPPSLSQVVKVEKDTKTAGRIHKVQPGDSMYKLAAKYYNDGTKWDKILDANKKVLKSQNYLRIGQELIIPEL
ncbi:MAG: LysM peptidoglycan-binding domain-containing protein [wastewater metagenome]|nr:LysM peptidoglycan-binding domain-containing protein [Candidatus Loosdrechtia aerotolerans]